MADSQRQKNLQDLFYSGVAGNDNNDNHMYNLCFHRGDIPEIKEILIINNWRNRKNEKSNF